jgi:RNA polymerase sigma factor (TIGR02999 family)
MDRITDDVTLLLDAWSRGEAHALDRLMEVVQEELRAIAGHFFRHERPDHTLQPTAVVNELYLKLAGQREVRWHSRAEFFAVAARGMRQVLVDHARRRHAEKRGGGLVRVAFDQDLGFPEAMAPDVVALDDALGDLERLHPRQSRIVEMRVLVGLTLEEIAAVEKTSRATVAREWRTARLFLLRQLRP